MPAKGDDLSMFRTLDEHNELINGNILPRLEKVESGQEEMKIDVKSMKNKVSSIETDVSAIRSAQNSMELTVLKDGAQTRDMLNRFVDHYLKVDGKKMETNEKVTLAKISTKEKVWLAIVAAVGGGGLATITSFVIEFYKN